LPLEAVDGAQHRTDGIGLDDRGPVGDRRGDQGAAKVAGRVPFGAPRCNGKTEDRADGAA